MTVDSITNYLMKVECKHCGDRVYPDEDAARDQAEYLVNDCAVEDIEELRSYIERTCDGCRHFLEKDD